MFERRGRRIRNLAKSLANLRKVANIICIDRDATRSRIRNSLVFEILRTGWTAFDERKTIRLLSNSMELCRWKILPRFIGDDLSQFYIENAFNFKMRQFHLSPYCHRTYCKTSNVSLGLRTIRKWTG